MAFELKTIFHLNALWYNFYLRRNIHSHFPVFRQPDSRFVNFSLSAYFFFLFRFYHHHNCYRFHSVADDFPIASTLWLDGWSVGWSVCVCFFGLLSFLHSICFALDDFFVCRYNFRVSFLHIHSLFDDFFFFINKTMKNEAKSRYATQTS